MNFFYILTEKSEKEEAVKRSIKECLSRLLKCDPLVVKEQLSNLVNRLNDCHKKKEDTSIYLGRLFLRIHSQYPGDVGCFVIYFLNYMKLKPFESIFFGPNVPHAYIDGGEFLFLHCLHRCEESYDHFI